MLAYEISAPISEIDAYAMLFEDALENTAVEMAMAFNWLKPAFSFHNEVCYVDNFVELVYADDGFDLAYDIAVALESHQAGELPKPDLDRILRQVAEDTIFEEFEPWWDNIEEFQSIPVQPIGCDLVTTFDRRNHRDVLAGCFGLECNGDDTWDDYEEQPLPDKFGDRVISLRDTLPNKRNTVGEYVILWMSYILGSTGNPVLDWPYITAMYEGVEEPSFYEIADMNDVQSDADTTYRKISMAEDWLLKHPWAMAEVLDNYQRSEKGEHYVGWTAIFDAHLSIYDTQDESAFPRFWRDNAKG